MKKRENIDWQIKNRKIFVFVFEELKLVFVNDTVQKNLLKVYEEHYKEKYVSTRQAFSACKQAQKVPPMYLLEEIKGTSSDAFQHIIGWCRYFSEHGYGCLASPKVLDLVHSEATNVFFQSVKAIPIDQIIAPEKNLFPNFGKKAKENGLSTQNSGPKSMSLKLTESQYQMLRRCSHEKHISMREYIVNCLDEKAGTGLINSVQMEDCLQKMNQYVHEINAFQWELQEIIDQILCSKSYEITHLQQMSTISDMVMESNEGVKNEIIHLYQQLRDMKHW